MKVRYLCEHCGFTFYEEKLCLEHEKTCFLAPKKIPVTLYLHSYKDSNWAAGKKAGIPAGKALENFCYALCEVKFDLLVDRDTGLYEIIKVDDRILGKSRQK